MFFQISIFCNPSYARKEKIDLACGLHVCMFNTLGAWEEGDGDNIWKCFLNKIFGQFLEQEREN
jgi:hypothetical protein